MALLCGHVVCKRRLTCYPPLARDYEPRPCSAGSSSPAGATSGTQCKCTAGHYQTQAGTPTVSATCPPCRSKSSCPQGKYLDGTCGGFSDYTCEACPQFSSTKAAGATAIGQCACASGYFDNNPSPTDVTCLPCKASCPRGTHLAGKCSATSDFTCATCLDPTSCAAGTYLSGDCAGHADYVCAPCPVDCKCANVSCKPKVTIAS